MQDEQIDKLIRDAANQHHPPYDDTAWGKMRAILDKHLPQKKDRKNPLVLLLLFLLLGGTIITVLLQPWKSKPGTAETTNTKQPVTAKQEFITTPKGNPAATINDNATAPAISDKKNTVTEGIAIANQVSTGNNTPKTRNSNKDTYRLEGRTLTKVKTPEIGNYTDENKIRKNDTVYDEPASSDNESLKEISPKAIPEKSEDQKQITVAAKKDTVNTTVRQLKETATIKNNTRASKEKNKNSFVNNFALTFSGGADISYINISNAGKLKLFYGAGLRYTIAKRVTISSGLYVSKKIYTAKPSQYKFSGGTTYPYLQKINADCKVFEIPLNVSYNFKAVKKHNWFSGLGLSSYFMKKEVYDYVYKPPSGPSYNYIHTVSNKNQHFLSVLTLSGGYQYKLNNRVSLIAEPYIKLHLKGVGSGKVKLNNTGLMVTAAIKPFKQQKK